MPSYRFIYRQCKRSYAEGYAAARQREQREIAKAFAPVSEILNQQGDQVNQSAINVRAYEKLSVFWIECGDCGNPLYVHEINKRSIALACAACGVISESDRLPFTETNYLTMDANEFNLEGGIHV